MRARSRSLRSLRRRGSGSEVNAARRAATESPGSGFGSVLASFGGPTNDAWPFTLARRSGGMGPAYPRRRRRAGATTQTLCASRRSPTARGQTLLCQWRIRSSRPVIRRRPGIAGTVGGAAAPGTGVGVGFGERGDRS
jgi:hypothetical protein